jgi:hypothetical protein
MTKRVRQSLVNPGRMTVQSKVVDVDITPYRERLIGQGFVVSHFPMFLIRVALTQSTRLHQIRGASTRLQVPQNGFVGRLCSTVLGRGARRVAMIVSGGLSTQCTNTAALAYLLKSLPRAYKGVPPGRIPLSRSQLPSNSSRRKQRTS